MELVSPGACNEVKAKHIKSIYLCTETQLGLQNLILSKHTWRVNSAAGDSYWKSEFSETRSFCLKFLTFICLGIYIRIMITT